MIYRWLDSAIKMEELYVQISVTNPSFIFPFTICTSPWSMNLITDVPLYNNIVIVHLAENLKCFFLLFEE